MNTSLQNSNSLNQTTTATSNKNKNASFQQSNYRPIEQIVKGNESKLDSKQMIVSPNTKDNSYV